MDTLPGPPRLTAPRPPSQCRLEFFLEAFAAQCIVAVGGVAYLLDDFFVEVRLEYGVVSFAPDFFTGAPVSNVAYYGLWVGGARYLLGYVGGAAGAIVKWRAIWRVVNSDSAVKSKYDVE